MRLPIVHILILFLLITISCSTSKKDKLLGDWYCKSDSMLVLSIKNDVIFYAKHLINNQGFNSYSFNENSNLLSIFLKNRYDSTKIDTMKLTITKINDNQIELSTDYINPFLVLERKENFKEIRMQDFKELTISTYYCIPDKILDIKIKSDGNVFFCGYSRTKHIGSFVGKLNSDEIIDIKNKLWYHKTDTTMKPKLKTDILKYKIEIVKTNGEKEFKEVYFNDNNDFLTGLTYLIELEAILKLRKTDSITTFSTRDYSRLSLDRERQKIVFLD